MNELKPGDKLSTIPWDAVIKVPMSGAFYSRIQQCFFALMDHQMKVTDDPTGEKTNAILKELESRDPENLWETLVTVNLALLFEAEKSAKEQGVIVKEEALKYVPKDASQEASPES